MVRKILGVVFGVIVAGMAVVAGEFIMHSLWPMPQPDPMDAEAMRAFMAGVPMKMKAGLAVTYAVATFLGAAVAAGIARGRWAGWVVATLMLMATVANFVMLPHPIWLMAACLAAIVGAGWIATRIGSKT